MDPMTWTTAIGLTALGVGAVLAGTGNADAVPTPSPATLRRAARVTAAGTLAAGVALGGAGTAAADQLPPDIPASIPSAAAGPDNQAPLPGGRPWMDAVTPWATTDQHATTLPAPEVVTPKRPARTARPAGPKRPRAVLPRRVVRAVVVTVQRGDTLSGIARAHGTTIAALAEANRATHPSLTANPDHIEAGWLLRIPGAR